MNPIGALIFGVIVLVAIAALIRTGHIGLLFFLLFNLMGGGGRGGFGGGDNEGGGGFGGVDSEGLAEAARVAVGRAEAFKKQGTGNRERERGTGNRERGTWYVDLAY